MLQLVLEPDLTVSFHLCSQVLVLPPFQRMGHCATLIQTFYNDCYINRDIKDITGLYRKPFCAHVLLLTWVICMKYLWLLLVLWKNVIINGHSSVSAMKLEPNKSCIPGLLVITFNEIERGVYWYHLVRLSVCGQNCVRSVSSTILIRSISYLHILSSNFRRWVTFKARYGGSNMKKINNGYRLLISYMMEGIKKVNLKNGILWLFSVTDPLKSKMATMFRWKTGWLGNARTQLLRMIAIKLKQF